MSAPEQSSLSYQELAALVVGLTSQLDRAHARIAELEARLGRDSTNSSGPPSADSIAAKAKRRADRSSRERSADRKPGGQPGRKGSGLAPTVTPDRTETLPPPADCSGCGGDLTGAADAGVSWAQVWDIPPIVMEKVHYLLPRRAAAAGARPPRLDPHAQRRQTGTTSSSSAAADMQHAPCEINKFTLR